MGEKTTGRGLGTMSPQAGVCWGGFGGRLDDRDDPRLDGLVRSLVRQPRWVFMRGNRVACSSPAGSRSGTVRSFRSRGVVAVAG